LDDELLHGVHGAHRGLDHWEANEPLRLGRVVEEVIPGEGDDGILGTGLLDGIGGEGDVLIGDLRGEEGRGDGSE
jgi:hypothetical protein